MWFKKETRASRLFDIAKHSTRNKIIYPARWMMSEVLTEDNELVDKFYLETYYSKMIDTIEDSSRNGGLSINFIFHEALDSTTYEETLDAFRLEGFSAYEPDYIGHEHFKRMYVSWDKHWIRQEPKRYCRPEKPFFYPW